MSPTQIQKFFSSSSCSYIMADLRVEAKSFVTSLPLFPLSKDFTNICKTSAVWVGDSSSGNLLPFTAHLDQHCVLYLNLGRLLCGYMNKIRNCFHITNVRLVINTHRFVTMWTFLMIISWCTYALLRALFDYLFIFIHSATNVTLDIPFTSYITSLTYKHY